jgi:pimeloyl-ACP methyl ester carboxylesterase
MRRPLVLALVATLGLTACASSTNTAAVHQSPAAASTLSGTIGAAAFQIEMPARWNGTLFLWSHGYVAPGANNPASAAPDPLVAQWLLGGGYAIAGSSYSSTGWAVEDALKDQVALVDYFTRHQGAPKRVIAIGASLGGLITAGLVQVHPELFAGALPLCGALAGGVGAWNSALDAAYAFKTLLAPRSALQLVDIKDPAANLQTAKELVTQLGSSPQVQARMALVSALTDLPGWFLPTEPEPAAGDYVGQAAAQFQWETRVDFPFAFSYRAELEKRAGGNPSSNDGVDYAHQLSISTDRAEVMALYRAAGLDLNADLRALNAGASIKPDAGAAAYLRRNISFDGKLSVPVLTMHTTDDGLVVPQDETAYADLVRAAGKQDLLRQVFVHRAGHCAFTSAEVVTLIKVMLNRLDTGRWDDGALAPATMNSAALTLGAGANSIGGFFAAQPAFTAFTAGPYLRP